MNEDNKRKMRELIEKDNWTRYGQIDKGLDNSLWNKETEVFYEDESGNPCKAKAIIIKQKGREAFFRAMTGPNKGKKLKGVFAYKLIELIEPKKTPKYCKDCEHFHIVQEPLPDHWDSGMAECKKHNLVTHFFDKRKFNRLTCIEEKNQEEL